MDYELIKRDYGYKVEYLVRSLKAGARKDMTFDNERDAMIALRMVNTYKDGFKESKIETRK